MRNEVAEADAELPAQRVRDLVHLVRDLPERHRPFRAVQGDLVRPCLKVALEDVDRVVVQRDVGGCSHRLSTPFGSLILPVAIRSASQRRDHLAARTARSAPCRSGHRPRMNWRAMCSTPTSAYALERLDELIGRAPQACRLPAAPARRSRSMGRTQQSLTASGISARIGGPLAAPACIASGEVPARRSSRSTRTRHRRTWPPVAGRPRSRRRSRSGSVAAGPASD